MEFQQHETERQAACTEGQRQFQLRGVLVGLLALGLQLSLQIRVCNIPHKQRQQVSAAFDVVRRRAHTSIQ
jgi:hypothetical protein